MTSTTVYRLALPFPQRAMPFVVMGVMSAVGVGFLISIFTGTAHGALMVAMLGWCAVLVWNWTVLLSIPYEIRFDTADQILFVALARTVALTPAEIHSITPVRSGGGFYVVQHRTGRIWLLGQFNGFDELVARIKARNPNVT